MRTLGGEIELESEQSVGTTVRITLATASRQESPSRADHVSPRILVVDDEPSLVRGLTYALERDKFEVEVATDGEAAVDAALTQAIDLVILDLMLPKLSGEEACRADPGRAATCRSSCSPRRTPSASSLDGLELGADDYVTKPFSAAELIGRVSARCSAGARSTTAANEQLVRTVGAITIDLVRDEVSVEGSRSR